MPETPEKLKVSYSKKSALWMTAGIVLFLCVCNFLKIKFFEELENKTIDFRFSVRGERNPRKLPSGFWPWTRKA